MKIILGSQSKGRKRMMEEMGYQFEIMASNIDEKSIRNEDPKELTLALARAKAQALMPKISEPAILITSDQVVMWNGQIREKPENIKEVKEFLKGYNAHPSINVTAVVVTNTKTGQQADGLDIAKVYFWPFSDIDIEEIIKTENVLQYAGGFTIEGKAWEKHVKKIEGTRDSVLGLPKDLTKKLIEEVGGLSNG